MFSEEQEQRSGYHHGNVKEALVDAAMQFIEANDTERLSLRQLAKEVGITPSAIYNHFSDKNALMLAVKLRLYEEIDQYFAAHCLPSADPEQYLLDTCLAYYHFAQEYPARFRILFASTLPREWSTPEFVEVSCRCLVRTRKTVLDIYNKYNIACSESDVVNTTLLIWSQLHGIIALKNSGSIEAAVAYQDWPANCALSADDDVRSLISSHVTMTVNAILNSRYREERH